jgi:hypothetical protein
MDVAYFNIFFYTNQVNAGRNCTQQHDTNILAKIWFKNERQKKNLFCS